MTTELPPSPRAPSLLSAHADVSIPAAALVASLLSVLTFDFDRGLSALVVHAAVWFVAGAAVALLLALALGRIDHLAVGVLAGAVVGAALGAASGFRGHDLLLPAGAGVVLGALVQLLSTLERRDMKASVLMSLLFFLLITTFWIAKSIKKGLLVGHYKAEPLHFLGYDFQGDGAEQLAKVGNMFLAFFAMVVFTWLSRRFKRERLVLLFSVVFTAAFLGFALVIAAPQASVAWGFYWLGDLFNTVMLAAFFAFLNDSVQPEQAKRLYPLVVFGGVFGGVFGSSAVRFLRKAVGEPALVAACAGAVLLMGLIAWLASRSLSPPAAGTPTSKAAAEPAAAEAQVGNPALAGARLVLASPYLLSLVGIVALYEFCSATLDYQWTAMQVATLATSDEIKAHTSGVFAITNWAGMLVQLLVTGPLLRRAGVGAALLVLPVVFLVNSSLFLVFPTLLFAAALSVSDNSLNYSVNQSARETLYTPTSREEKYKAKAFIDMFVQRFAKVLAIGLSLSFAAMSAVKAGSGAPPIARWLSIVVLLLLVVWIAAARYAGRRFRELSGTR